MARPSQVQHLDLATHHMKSSRLKRGRPKHHPPLAEFHDQVSENGCALAYLSPCWGRVWGHHYIPKQRLKDKPAAYVDPRNGVGLCMHHHQQVEWGRLECPRPVDLDAFLAEHDVVERGA